MAKVETSERPPGKPLAKNNSRSKSATTLSVARDMQHKRPQEAVGEDAQRTINDFSVDKWLPPLEISEQLWSQVHAAFVETYHPTAGTLVRSGGRRFCDDVNAWPDERFVRKEFYLLSWLHLHQHGAQVEFGSVALEQLRDRVLLALNLPTWGYAGRTLAQAAPATPVTVSPWGLRVVPQPASAISFSASATAAPEPHESLPATHAPSFPSSPKRTAAAPDSSYAPRYTKTLVTQSTGEKAPPRDIAPRVATASTDSPVAHPHPTPLPVQLGNPRIGLGGDDFSKSWLWMSNRDLFRRVYGDVADQVDERSTTWDMQPLALQVASNDPTMRSLYELIIQRRIFLVDSDSMAPWRASNVLMDKDGQFYLFHPR